MRRTGVQTAKAQRGRFVKQAASLVCALALCAAPFALSACSSGDATSQQAASQEAQTEAATTEAAEEVQPIYVVSKTSYSYDGISTSRTCTYDESGNCVSSTYDVSGESEEYSYHRETTTEYDEQGAPVSQTVTSTSSESTDEISAAYEATLDETGRLTALAETYDESNIDWTYSYDAEGALVSMTSTNTTSDGDATSSWTFNEYGWATEVTYDGGTDDSVTETITYEGDDPAHPTTATETITYSESMGIEPETYSYTLSYDENGNLAKVESTGDYEGAVWAYEYQKVESPGVIAATAASLKMAGGGAALF